jgi:hypothetical protein
MTGDSPLDISALYADYARCLFRGWGGGRAITLDGLIVYQSARDEDDGVLAYTQVFPSGFSKS